MKMKSYQCNTLPSNNKIDLETAVDKYSLQTNIQLCCLSSGTSLCADCIHFHIISCECVRVPFSATIIVSVYLPRPATTCASYLPSEYGFLGHKTIPLVRDRNRSCCCCYYYYYCSYLTPLGHQAHVSQP